MLLGFWDVDEWLGMAQLIPYLSFSSLFHAFMVVFLPRILDTSIGDNFMSYTKWVCPAIQDQV